MYAVVFKNTRLLYLKEETINRFFGFIDQISKMPPAANGSFVTLVEGENSYLINLTEVAFVRPFLNDRGVKEDNRRPFNGVRDDGSLRNPPSDHYDFDNRGTGQAAPPVDHYDYKKEVNQT